MINFCFIKPLNFLDGSVVKNSPATQETQEMQETQAMGSIPVLEDPLKQEMATHSSILAWEIPWTEELDRL